jgi:hypothetical protein
MVDVIVVNAYVLLAYACSHYWCGLVFGAGLRCCNGQGTCCVEGANADYFVAVGQEWLLTNAVEGAEVGTNGPVDAVLAGAFANEIERQAAWDSLYY